MRDTRVHRLGIEPYIEDPRRLLGHGRPLPGPSPRHSPSGRLRHEMVHATAEDGRFVSAS